MSSIRGFAPLAVGLIACAASGGVVCAQSAGGTAASNRSGQLDEVIVTAERREESLNDMAIAGEAFSTSELEKRGILKFEDLANNTPSLSIRPGAQNRYVTIRGVGLNALTATITSGVAIHVDGLPLWGAGIALGQPFYDLERVEVLRGPQGTFVGQNSTGGAVYIISKAPELNETDFSIQQTYGSYSWSDTVAAGNLPLGDTTAIRVAVKSERRDSYFRNVGSYDRIFGYDPSARSDSPGKLANEDTPGDLNLESVRAKFLWEPSDSFSLELMHERYKLRTDGTARQPIYNFANALYVDEIKAYDDPYLLHYNTPSRFDEDIDRSLAEINWQITDGMSLRAITGVQHFTQWRVEDVDATPHPIMELWYEEGGADPATPYMGFAGSPLTETGAWSDSQIGRNITTTHEVNLLSTTDSPLQWSVGLFYAGQDNQQDSLTSTLEDRANRQSTTIMDNQSIQSNRAAFGQVTWALSDQVEIVAGLRWNKDKSENPGNRFTIYRPNPQNSATAAVRPPFTIARTSIGKFDNSKTTGKLSLNWHLSDDQMVYGTISQGYKAGNFNNQNPTATVQPPPQFDPENVDSFEVGWKSTMMDGRLHADLTGFRTDYKDYQLAYYEPAPVNSTITTNLSKARIQGFELQIRAQFGGFGANLAAASLDTEVVDSAPFRDPRNNSVAVDLEGRVLPYAPDTTFNAGIQYDLPLSNGVLTPRLQYAKTDDQWGSIFQLPSFDPTTGAEDGGVSPDFLPGYHTVDFSLTWSNDNWMIQAFASNMTDETYVLGIAGNNRLYSAPKQVGLRFRYQSD